MTYALLQDAESDGVALRISEAARQARGLALGGRPSDHAPAGRRAWTVGSAKSKVGHWQGGVPLSLHFEPPNPHIPLGELARALPEQRVQLEQEPAS